MKTSGDVNLKNDRFKTNQRVKLRQMCLSSVHVSVVSLVCAVAVHHHHAGGEGADHRRVPGLSLPGGQHLLAAVVGAQPAGRLAASRHPLPDLLRHVRLHGPGLRR